MSTLHQQLDEMDRKLNVMETEVKDTDHVSMETDAYKELYREQILQEHQEMVCMQMIYYLSFLLVKCCANNGI